MIVFDLKCYDGHHVFECWFGSNADYERQRDSGMIACPYCGDTHVRKAVMAPNVGQKSNQKTAVPARPAQPAPAMAPAASSAPPAAPIPAPAAAEGLAVTNGVPGTAQMVEMVEALAKAQSEMLANAEWVGRQFADRARAIHYGEEPASAIYGEVAGEEARSLIEEGIEVAALPLPVVPPSARN